jgi:hypothetical protein
MLDSLVLFIGFICAGLAFSASVFFSFEYFVDALGERRRALGAPRMEDATQLSPLGWRTARD